MMGHKLAHNSTRDNQMVELGAVLDGSSQMLGTRALNVVDCGILEEGGEKEGGRVLSRWDMWAI